MAGRRRQIWKFLAGDGELEAEGEGRTPQPRVRRVRMSGGWGGRGAPETEAEAGRPGLALHQSRLGAQRRRRGVPSRGARATPRGRRGSESGRSGGLGESGEGHSGTWGMPRPRPRLLRLRCPRASRTMELVPRPSPGGAYPGPGLAAPPPGSALVLRSSQAVEPSGRRAWLGGAVGGKGEVARRAWKGRPLRPPRTGSHLARP